jgi:hypothetical protein
MGQFRTIDLYSFDPDLIDRKKVDRYLDAHDKRAQKGLSKESKPKLKVVIDATHSGSLINHRIYTSKQMRKAVPSWTSPKPKPILTHHRSSDSMFGATAEDPIGRITDAKYIEFPNANTDEDFVVDRKGGKGSGAIIVDATISDPEAIDKILDGRYMTVSSAQDTEDASCSICGASIREGGCEHVPGRAYPLQASSPVAKVIKRSKKFKKGDAKEEEEPLPEWPCYAIWDRPINYKELSFVNIPAQEWAGLMSATMAEDSDSAEALAWSDVYNGQDDHSGVMALQMTDGVATGDLLVDDVQREPRGTYTSAPETDAAPNTTMNTDEPEKTPETNDETPASMEPDTKETAMPEELKKLQDQVAALTSASQRLESDNAALKKQVEELTAKLTASDAELKKVNESLVHSLADRLIVVRQFVGDLPKDLEGDALKKVKDELYARSLLSIQDAIKDVEPKLRVALKPETAKTEPKAEPTVSKDTVAAAGTVQDPTLHSTKEPGTQPVSGRPSTASILGF